MNKIYAILGGNLGNRVTVIRDACNLIIEKVGPIIEKSSFYETEPWGFESDLAFLNQVIGINTEFEPHVALKKILNIETELGRVRNSEQWIDRVIDIDILFFNNQVIQTDNFIVPHKEIQNRKFVLKPLCEVVPDYLHPVLGVTVKELFLNCTDASEVVIYNVKK
ncbi:MAG: 2-amino-4-hydroxy-6-hydroxymethyldihydropteridine diphosphokinase [Flavobacteriales bacterium]|nr:2-amino-4-hydroxy-6-hydroxymethyldihydropteridine diphosphokinase [Flavobacteriales bacterium]